MDRDFGTEDIAKVMNQVMANLGFESYVVQAGDIGSKVARILGVDYDACRGESSLLSTYAARSWMCYLWDEIGW